MGTNARRNFVRKIAAIAAYVTGTKLFAQQAPAASPSASAPPSNTDKDTPRRNAGEHHIHDGLYYISGTGSNDGYPKEDHVLVTDPFEKHVTRTMDALKKSVERAGCTMDSIMHLQVFLCLPHADRQGMFRCPQSAVRRVEQDLRDLFLPGKSAIARLHGPRVDSG